MVLFYHAMKKALAAGMALNTYQSINQSTTQFYT